MVRVGRREAVQSSWNGAETASCRIHRLTGCLPFAWAFITVATACGQSLESQDVPDLKTIAAQLEAQSSLMNVQIVHFSLKEEKRTDESAAWVPMQETMHGNAWYNGLLGSKLRIQLDYISRGFSSPWVEHVMDVGYDGQTMRRVLLRAGPQGRESDVCRGSILAGPPDPSMNPLITVGIDPLLPYATGTGFSATFFVAPGESSPGSLVDLFEEAAKDGGGGWPIQWDTINGLKTVKVTVLGGWYLWFDPSSGYALRKFIQSPRDNTTGRWFAFKELDVSGLVEAAKGIWFPTRATYVGPVDGVGPHIRLTYQAEKIIVNNPSFDPHIFTVPIPPKCKLHDAINHRSFIVENISEIDDSISKDVKVLKAQGQQEPATVTSEVVPPAAVIFGTETRWDFRITYVLIVAAGGVLVVFLWRRLKSTRSSLVVFLTAMLFCVAFAHKSVEADGLANSSSDAVSVNCGVCDACFCLQWFNRNADLEQVANQMSAGEFYDRPCSMWDLKQTINNYNLQADGFKADSIKEIVNSLQPTSLAIVQLSPGPDGNDLGHYVVLVRVRSQMAVVDPPAPIRFCTKEEIVNDLELSRATGAFLLVSERQSAPKVFGPSFNISSQVINVGHVPVNKPEFTASFSYTDVGTEPLKILNTRLPCSCMKPPTGDFTVLPGQTGTIYVPFTRNTLGGGHVSRSILLQTNDPHHAAVSIRFEMDLDPISLPTELSVAPRQVDYGRSDAQGVVDQPVIITVTIPHKTKASAPSIIQTEVSSHEITLEPVKDSADDRNMPMGDGIWWEMVNYKMRWLEIPRPGNISENLTFKVATADGRNETFEVGVRGEIPAAP